MPHRTQSDREEKFSWMLYAGALRSRLTTGSATEAASSTPEVSTAAASTATELASTARTATTTAPVSTSSLALVLSATSATTTVVLDLREAVVSRRLGYGFGGIVSPALGAGDRCRLVRSLSLSGVARDDLEGLAERLVLTGCLLVPLC